MSAVLLSITAPLELDGKKAPGGVSFKWPERASNLYIIHINIKYIKYAFIYDIYINVYINTVPGCARTTNLSVNSQMR